MENGNAKPGNRFENTLVAFFDIQAYSDFVRKSEASEVIDRTRNLYESIKHTAPIDFASAKSRFWFLSDSIIIAIDTSHAPLTFGASALLIGTCAQLLRMSLDQRMPLRGAIGYGYLYFDESLGRDRFGDASFLLGSALVDAAEHEKKQDWLGARFTPNAVSVLKKLHDNSGKTVFDAPFTKGLCAHGEIPLKTDRREAREESGSSEQGYFILPIGGGANWKDSLPEHFDKTCSKVKKSEVLYSST